MTPDGAGAPGVHAVLDAVAQPGAVIDEFARERGQNRGSAVGGTRRGQRRGVARQARLGVLERCADIRFGIRAARVTSIARRFALTEPSLRPGVERPRRCS
jgi:hypothetical protein